MAFKWVTADFDWNMVFFSGKVEVFTLNDEPVFVHRPLDNRYDPKFAVTRARRGKFVLLAAVLAVAQAGGPAAYSTYTTPIGYGSVGSTHESTVKGYGGNSVISQYSKAVDTPYSSVRKYDTRISNDAFAYAPAAAHAYAAPAVAYGAPAYYGAGYRAYGAAPALAYGAGYRTYGAAPALAYGAGYRAYGGVPAYASAYHGAAYAPAIAKTAVAAPLGVAYSAAPSVAHLSFSGFGAAYGY
ncbi:hypothetical protein C0J52_17941 [Blattella germanica]|nr:hypothetical protein C0J52_17941 [Blattella germanica]